MTTVKTQATIPSLTKGIKRPHWVCSLVNQRVGLVRDRSGSMRGDKGAQASQACNELLAELAHEENKDAFHVAVVDFDTEPVVVSDFRKASSFNGQIEPIKSRAATNITCGLEKMSELVINARAGEGEDIDFLRDVVIVLSDGGHNTGPNPMDVSNKIKESADLVFVAYGYTPSGEDLGRKMATSEQHFFVCKNGADLRQFLASVGKTMVNTVSQNVNATRAISEINNQ